MDPKETLSWNASPIERRLLDAARHDRIPDAVRARMADGLGVHVMSGALSTTAASGAQLGAPLFAKFALWGSLSIALVTAVGWRAMQGAPAPAMQPHEPAGASRVEPAQPTTEVPSASAPAQTQLASIEQAADLEQAPPRARIKPTDHDAALRAEIALLDRARNAIREGEGALALQILAQHRQRFARGRLVPEATALQVEALMKRGALAQARVIAERFAHAHPSHPLREHLLGLVAASAHAGPSPSN